MPDVQMNGIEFEVKSNADDAAQSLDTLAQSLRKLKSATSGGLGLKAVAKETVSLKSALSAMTGFGKSIVSITGAPLKKAISGIEGMASGFKTLFSSLKRIAFYRIIRTVIKEIGASLEEGSKNAYHFSKSVGGSVKYIASAYDALSSASYKMSNQAGAAWSTLLAQIQPVLNSIISIVTQATAVITQFFAALGGHATFLKAIDYTHEWEEATAGGAAAAKEWKNQLMGFDELNRLEEPSKGGGGGGSSLADYSNMFEEAEISSEITDFVARIREAFQNADWQGLGSTIGEKVNDLVNNINWGGIGTKVGQYINALFSTEYWTLSTVNFQNIGAKVAEFMNSAMSNIDFSNLGGVIAQKLTILPDLIIGAINNLDFSRVGKSIGDTIKGFFNNLGEWIESVDWGELTHSVIDGLVDFAHGLDFGEVLDSLVGAGGAIMNALDDIWDAVLDYIPNGWTLVKAWFSDYVVRGVAQWGIDIANGLAKPIEDGINSLIDKLNGFIENHPKVAEFLGIDQLEHIEFNLIPNLDPPVGTFYQQTKSAIEAASKKNPTNVNSKANMTSFATAFTSGALTGAGSPILSVQAKFNSFYNDLTGNKKPAIPTKANLNALINSLTGDKKPTIPSKANLNSVLNSLTGNKKPSVGTQANFNSFFNGLTSKKIPSIPSIAQYQWANKDNLTEGQKTIGTIANIFKINIDKTKVSTDGNNIKLNATANVTKVNNRTGNVMVTQANGGLYSGGKWHDIQRFAGGGLARGSQLFWAREAGPELVGTLGGHTAVMNNNQIVSSVSAGVARAVAGVRFSLQGGTDSGNEDALYNAMLRALNDADNAVEVDLDGETIYRSVLKRNRRETFRTGANPMTATA